MSQIVKPKGSITVTKSKCIVSKVNKEPSKLAKIVSKILETNSKTDYAFGFQVRYKGSFRLKKDDIIVDEQGLKFLVTQEKQWNAAIMCTVALSIEPRVHGRFTVYSKQ